jgi:hypothetical protein
LRPPGQENSETRKAKPQGKVKQSPCHCVQRAAPTVRTEIFSVFSQLGIGISAAAVTGAQSSPSICSFVKRNDACKASLPAFARTKLRGHEGTACTLEDPIVLTAVLAPETLAFFAVPSSSGPTLKFLAWDLLL